MRQADAAGGRAGRAQLTGVFFILLMDIIGLTIIIPVAPFIVRRYTDDALWVTLLTSAYAAAQFVAAPALGKISDRVGRRPVLLWSVLGSALGYLVFGLGGALWVLVLSRLIDGISGGNQSTAAAYIADISSPEERPKNFGLIGMAYGLGFIIGPALGGAASQLSLEAPAFLACALSLASAASIWWLLPESLPAELRDRAPMRASDLNPLVAIGEVWRLPGLALLLAISCVFSLAFDGVNSALPLFVSERFAAQPWEIGLLLVATGVVTAVTQAALVPRAVARFGEKRMALASQLGLAAGALVVVAAPALWWLYPNILLTSCVGGFIWSTLGSLVAGRVAPAQQGRVAGVSAALQSVMAAAGPLAAGLLYDGSGPAAPFVAGAAGFLAAAALALAIRPAPVPSERRTQSVERPAGT